MRSGAKRVSGVDGAERFGSMRGATVARLAVFVCCAIGLAACGGGASPASTPSAANRNIGAASHVGGSVSGSHGNYVVKGAHGTTKFNLNSSSLPKGFPSSVPLPSGSSIVSSVTSNQAGVAGWQVTLGAPGPVQVASSEYETQLSNAGFASLGTYQTQQAYGIQATKGKWKVVVSITPSTTGASGLGLPSNDVVIVLMVSSTSASAPPGS